MTRRELRRYSPNASLSIRLTIEVVGYERGRVYLANDFTDEWTTWHFPSGWFRRRSMTDAVLLGVAAFEDAVRQYERAVAEAEIARELADAAVDIAGELSSSTGV